MPQFNDPSVLIFVAFGIVAIAVAVLVGFFLMDRISPVVAKLFGGASPVSRLEAEVQRVLPRRRQPEDQAQDDLEDSTALLLSLIPGSSIVVDEDDEVVRASPAAYTLGVVVDDAIANERVLDEIHHVRSSGGRVQFNVETRTPWQYEHAFDNLGDEAKESRRRRSVSRPNWLKVTVGRISERFVVVMVEDLSDVIRFAQTRDSFITNVSEQLLKPTEALMALADSLEQGDSSRERIERDARQVRAACGHLNRMVSDLLLLIKAQEPITPSAANAIALRDPLAAVVAAAGRTAADRSIQLTLTGDVDLKVHGDADQIRTAVAKLVDNAVSYSDDGGAVSVTVRASEDGGKVEVRVIDRGCGIPQREQTHVFERFYRGSNQNERTADGIGLGLAIVKHVALTHHGAASVWSRVGQGSTFTLSLPVAR
ncbi:cell wall metabolism sensor histidine kinase WalK [uncultured Bifidobacterium sp.]|uniref:sensor histidine kinase n=1 Tax=uncultured Bifidobacterium sp. TaxID=165187 RepID=UPI002591F421|nr:ATP-binding protein [uncultured Bifidobacterium sp.]